MRPALDDVVIVDFSRVTTDAPRVGHHDELRNTPSLPFRSPWIFGR
ncbi:MAG: hypothetical protein ITG02_05185 [Patulibacter sp.]|nr:hypothetical protein [Patulibacter sp.]